MPVSRWTKRGIFALAGLLCISAAELPAAGATPDLAQQVSAARIDYFRGLKGDREAEERAQREFASLQNAHPRDATVMAYEGSLQLLEAARTWAVWNKHKLASDGLAKLDRAVQIAPEDLEVRFIHAETTWHLPFFYHRKDQAEEDFAFIAPRAERAAARGLLPPQLAAAALDDYGRILAEKSDSSGARQAFLAAVRVDSASPGGCDASRHLGEQAD